MGLAGMYPEEWYEILPGTLLARRLFGGFLNPEGILAAFVLNGLILTIISLFLWSAYETFRAGHRQ
jgi:hypothetical protein